MSAKTKSFHLFHKLNSKFIMSLCVFAAAILASSCSLGYFEYKNNVEALYNADAYHVAREAAAILDGDKLEGYAQSRTVDDEYNRMKQSLETLRTNMDVVSIFVVKVDTPNEGDYLYLMDTLDEHDYEMSLGDDMKYPEQYRDQIKAVYYEAADLSREKIYYHSKTYGDNFFAIVPIFDSNSKVVAEVFVQSSIGKIKGTLRRYLLYAILAAAVIAFVVLIICLSYVNHNVITPIKKITAHASEFARDGNLSLSLEKIHTGDEIETLADSITKMGNDIHNYVENLAQATATREHMTAELNVAQQIQKNLFPYQFPAFPERKDFDIYANIRSCPAIGGSFYNFFLLDDNHLCFFIGDVSGNGIPTSMFSVITSTLMKNFSSDRLSPDKVLASTNNELSKNNDAGLSVDAFIAIINLETGTMTYSDAGDMYVLTKTSGASFEPLESRPGFPLGSMQQVHYSEKSIKLSQGDLVFLCTKGITEAVDEKGAQFGRDYTNESISGQITKEYSVEKISDGFYRALDDFTKDAEQKKDSTLLIFRYIGD